MIEFIQSFGFYKVQIVTGALSAAILAGLGVFVVLRRMVFAGVALSQAASTAVVVALLFELHEAFGESLILAITLVLFLPFYFLQMWQPAHSDAIFGTAFVVFAAVGQILLAVGAGAKNHLIAAFFGNIVTMSDQEWHHLWLPAILLLLLFVFLYHSFVSVSFDPVHARLSGLRVHVIDGLFFLMLSSSLTVSIYLMGSFYSIAHLIIPGLVGVMIARSIPVAILIAVVVSVLSTIVGFSVSLIPFTVGSDTINLPTSSSIILMLSLWLGGWLVIRLFHKSQ